MRRRSSGCAMHERSCYLFLHIRIDGSPGPCVEQLHSVAYAEKRLIARRAYVNHPQVRLDSPFGRGRQIVGQSPYEMQRNGRTTGNYHAIQHFRQPCRRMSTCGRRQNDRRSPGRFNGIDVLQRKDGAVLFQRGGYTNDWFCVVRHAREVRRVRGPVT